MKFTPLQLQGLLLVHLDWLEDERGGFARTFCQREFAAQGIAFDGVQANISCNKLEGTVRGMHYQDAAAPEQKLVRCISGRILDVALDLRPQSPTFGEWESVELSAADGVGIYIPPGFAHGFQTLQAEALVHYTMGGFYEPRLQRGIRWNDPAFSIRWPIPIAAISARDASFPDYVP